MGLRNVDLEDASPSPPPPVFTRLYSLDAFPFSPVIYSKYVDIARDFSSREKRKGKTRKQKSLEQISKKNLLKINSRFRYDSSRKRSKISNQRR